MELNDYRTKQKRLNKNRNLMIAYKWLAELHGVLCTDPSYEKTIKYHQKHIENALKLAKKYQDQYKSINEHIEFLIYKKSCKVNISESFMHIHMINYKKY